MKKAWKAGIAAGPILLIGLAAASLYLPYPMSGLSPLPVISLRILDGEGEVLREVLSDRGGRCRWVGLEEISPHVVRATLAAEDRAFFHHPGINPAAVIKAFFSNVKHGRVVSGASTISQQLARNLFDHRRTLAAKLHEAWVALRIEKRLRKEEILAQYLNRVCYGNMAYGIEAAARQYFDKSSADLSLAESALLAGLPRFPTGLNPYRNLPDARRRQRSILDRMRSLGWIEHGDWSRAIEERLMIIPEAQAFRAPHFCDFILGQLPPEIRYSRSTIHTTLDARLQRRVELLARNHLRDQEKRNIKQAAAVVLDNRSSRILCMVGSRDFFDERGSGQVNGALALRQPGSTLKPFTYGLALERGMTAASILEDREIEFTTPAGSYRPRNYDKTFHGPVRMRRALACSYNVPAVALLDSLGPDALYFKLRETGFRSLGKGAGFYGVGLTLGNGEVTLLELAQAYATLAGEGLFRPATGFLPLSAGPAPTDRRIFSKETVFILTHMLSDPDARVPAFGYRSPLSFPFPCAAKTGTSKDFRDNWTVGYTSRYTVGVWVGNFDGRPMHDVSGISGCGPLFRDIMLLLHSNSPALPFPEPEGLIRARICPISGKLASSDCPGWMEEIFAPGTAPDEECPLPHDRGEYLDDRPKPPAESSSPALTFPSDGDVFKLDPVLRRNYQTIRFRARCPVQPAPERLEWWLSGTLLGVTRPGKIFSWNMVPGSYTIELVACSGERRIRSRPVRFRVLR